MHTPLTSESPLRRAANLPSRRVEGEGMVVSTKKGSAIVLNGVGYDVWEWLAQPRRVDELIRLMTQHYSVSEQTAQADLLPFLERLRELELLQNDGAV